MVGGSFRQWWVPVALAICACGGRAGSNSAAAAGAAGAAGAVGANGGSSGANAAGMGGVSAGAGGATSACDPTMYSQAGVPNSQGCYAGTDQGWMQVPCLCELWLKNSTQSPLDVSLTLSLSGTLPAPTDVSSIVLQLQDPGAAFYTAWSEQAPGAPFAVVRSGDTTGVQLYAASVTLNPVVVPACSLFTGQANVDSGNALSMHADFLDPTGNVVLTSDGSCFRPPHL